MNLLEGILFLTLTIYGEARDQEYLNQLAVGNVVMNRVRNSGLTIKQEVLKDRQFSCFNDGVKIPSDMKSLANAVAVAILVYNGKDIVNNSTHYHEKSIRPYWAKHMVMVGVYGDHIFYKKLVKIKAERRKIVYENKIANSSSIGKHWGRRG